MKKKMQIIICFYQSETGKWKERKKSVSWDTVCGIMDDIDPFWFMDAHKLLCGAIL